MKRLSFILICAIAMQPQPLLAQPAKANAVAGKVVFAAGNNTAISATGEQRAIQQGDTVRSGDKLLTGNGQLQIRFSDNGFVSLKPKSQLVITEYAFNGKEDGTEKAFFSLVKGSLRAVTGAIGKHNKNAYKYQTPVATIGIRGTAFVLSFCNQDCFATDGTLLPDGLYVNNGEGRVYIQNNEGVIDLVRGQFAYVPDVDSQPEQIMQPPALEEMFREEAENFDFEYRETEQVVEVIRENPAETIGLGELSGIAFAGFGVSGGSLISGASGFAADGASNRIQADVEGVVSGFTFTDDRGTAASFDSGSARLINRGVSLDRGLSWGVWNGDFALGDFAEQSLYLHYIAANNLTAPDAIPRSGRIRYSGSMGDGSVLGTLGQLGSGEFVTDFSIVLDIDFAAGELSDLQLSGAFASGDSYKADLIASTPLLPGGGYGLTGLYTFSDRQETLLTGDTGFLFRGNAAEGLLGSYVLRGALPDLSIIGTYAVDQFQPFTPTVDLILGLTTTFKGDAGFNSDTLSLPSIDTSIMTDGSGSVTAYRFFDVSAGDIRRFSVGGARLIAERSGNDTALDASWGIWDSGFAYTDDGGAVVVSNPHHMAFMGFANPTDMARRPMTGSANFNIQFDRAANGAVNLITGELSDSFTANIGVDWLMGNFTNFDLAATFPDRSNFNMSMMGSGFFINPDVPLMGTFNDGVNPVSANGSANFQFANEARVIGGTFSIDASGTPAAIGTYLLGEQGLNPMPETRTLQN